MGHVRMLSCLAIPQCVQCTSLPSGTSASSYVGCVSACGGSGGASCAFLMPLPDVGLAAYGKALFGLRTLNDGSAAALPSIEVVGCSVAGLDLLLVALDVLAAAGAPVVVLVLVVVAREWRSLAAPSDQGSFPSCQGSVSGAADSPAVSCVSSESLPDESQARESKWHSLQQRSGCSSRSHIRCTQIRRAARIRRPVLLAQGFRTPISGLFRPCSAYTRICSIAILGAPCCCAALAVNAQTLYAAAGWRGRLQAVHAFLLCS